MWPPAKTHWFDFDVKYVVTTLIAVSALAISGFSFYATGLRVTDDLRVVMSDTPLGEPDFENRRFELNPASARVIFINAGMRSAVISKIWVLFVQPEENAPIPEEGCYSRTSIAVDYDALPFILRPGDMLTKDTALKETSDVKKATVDGIDVALIPFSTLNAKSEKVRYKVCVLVSFTTPSIEYEATSVSEFEDELGKDVIGYAYYGSGFAVESRPVQLIKRSGISLFGLD